VFRITVAESAETGLAQVCMRNTFPLSINSCTIVRQQRRNMGGARRVDGSACCAGSLFVGDLSL
jgi:hypothetical protein